MALYPSPVGNPGIPGLFMAFLVSPLSIRVSFVHSSYRPRFDRLIMSFAPSNKRHTSAPASVSLSDKVEYLEKALADLTVQFNSPQRVSTCPTPTAAPPSPLLVSLPTLGSSFHPSASAADVMALRSEVQRLSDKVETLTTDLLAMHEFLSNSKVMGNIQKTSEKINQCFQNACINVDNHASVMLDVMAHNVSMTERFFQTYLKDVRYTMETARKQECKRANVPFVKLPMDPVGPRARRGFVDPYLATRDMRGAPLLGQGRSEFVLRRTLRRVEPRMRNMIVEEIKTQNEAMRNCVRKMERALSAGFNTEPPSQVFAQAREFLELPYGDFNARVQKLRELKPSLLEGIHRAISEPLPSDEETEEDEPSGEDEKDEPSEGSLEEQPRPGEEAPPALPNLAPDPSEMSWVDSAEGFHVPSTPIGTLPTETERMPVDSAEFYSSLSTEFNFENLL